LRVTLPSPRPSRRRLLTALAAVILSFAGCAKKKPRIPAPAARVGSTQVGIASWYGHPYHGRRTASGEVYDMEKLTAAHRTLPFGVWVRIRNLSNGHSVEVRINDRGPFVEGRIVDLSRAAARAVQMIGPGTAKVRLEVIAAPASLPALAFFAVQVGAFRERSNAEALRRTMQRRHGTARLVLRDGDPPLWRVLVGQEPSFEHAAALAERIRLDSGSAFVVRLDDASS